MCFSLFDGKRFDLGLYEAGSTRGVTFSREGVSYIFCNIHPEMSAVVVALTTPLYAIADSAGAIDIHNVPAGEYELYTWVEGVPQPVLDRLTRRVYVGQMVATSDWSVCRLHRFALLRTPTNSANRTIRTPSRLTELSWLLSVANSRCDFGRDCVPDRPLLEVTRLMRYSEPVCLRIGDGWPDVVASFLSVCAVRLML